ncbi:hypothetical protein LPW26_14445 [Rhodopseudomonas sp. HC1]|uniref:hypothetical protein n=1 Tax=Rhodopseudomonas infernalis TaxID=2897386 RepID=UPI001EE90F4C|nr:hypothetical protein [Rhodopseudomonas infernalis]MCG6205848.1 hypothetical protein [Rhodopseudomonas infernalis]
MLIGILKDILERRRRNVVLAEADAADLMRGFGDSAYDQARTRARESDQRITLDANRPPEHWRRVGAIIAKRTGRKFQDTATKYLEQ